MCFVCGIPAGRVCFDCGSLGCEFCVFPCVILGYRFVVGCVPGFWLCLLICLLVV